jgi:hypothetical protein
MAVSIRAVLLLESEGLANETYTAVRPFRIYDFHGVVSTQAATTTTLQRQALGAGAFNAVSSALSDNAAAGTVARTTTLVPAEDDVAPTDVLSVTNSGAGRQVTYTAIVPR